MSVLVEKDGRIRKNTVLVECAVCCTQVLSRKDQLRKYCSRECSAEGRKDEIEARCGYCGRRVKKARSKFLKSKSGLVFCSREHKDWAQRLDSQIREIQPPHYGDGRTTYRERALREYGPKCRGCGYCELEGMLDVHHLDGDRSNNILSNLIVLCVFCHALTTRGFVEVTPTRKFVRQGPW